MKMMQKVMMLAASMLLSASAYSVGVSVDNIEVSARYPWSGWVDIRFTLTCDTRPTATVTIAAKDKVSGRRLSVNTLWEQDGSVTNNYLVVEPGAKHFVWNAKQDLAEGFRSDQVEVTVTALSASDVESGKYFVIDLSAGPSATSYPKYFLDAIPAEGWTDEFKTTKLVMRRVRACTFKGLGARAADWSYTIGSGDWDDTKDVTLTKDYYIGVFPVTQKQWELVMGTNPSSVKGDMLPVDNVEWDDVRGTGDVTTWPTKTVTADSFIGRIRARIGYDFFDLPTYAQWECASRAGTITAFNNGKNGSVIFGDDTCIEDVAWYRVNATQIQIVGRKKPNKWGLYDMHGNVWEICLDHPTSASGLIDPIGDEKEDYRGGDWWAIAMWCQNGYSKKNWDGAVPKSIGFRLSWTYP